MGGGAVGRFADEQVRFLGWNLGGDEMSVNFAGVVTGEHDLETGDLNEEHGAAEDVASVVGGD